MALLYSGDLYLKEGAKKQSLWEQCPGPLPSPQRQQLTPYAGTPPFFLSEDRGSRHLPKTRALPDVEGWRRALHGTVAQIEGKRGCDCVDYQAVSPSCVSYGTAEHGDHVWGRSLSTAGAAAETVFPRSSKVIPQPLRFWLPCGQPSREPGMVQNLRTETVSCSTAVRQTCYYHVSCLRKKLAFLRGK